MAEKTFDQYEYIAVIVPGAALLLGLSIKWPQYLHDVISDKSLSLGDLGIFLLLAYIAGHILQSVAEVIDRIFWRLCGGLPTDWVRDANTTLISGDQRTALRNRVRAMTGNNDFSLDGVTREPWYGITRQIYAKVSAAGHAGRIDAFNRTFGLMRGFIVAMFAIGITFLVVDCKRLWGFALFAFALGVLALIRLFLFGRDYGRELFVQYLELPAQPAPAPQPPAIGLP